MDIPRIQMQKAGGNNSETAAVQGDFSQMRSGRSVLEIRDSFEVR